MPNGRSAAPSECWDGKWVKWLSAAEAAELAAKCAQTSKAETDILASFQQTMEEWRTAEEQLLQCRGNLIDAFVASTTSLINLKQSREDIISLGNARMQQSQSMESAAATQKKESDVLKAAQKTKVEEVKKQELCAKKSNDSDELWDMVVDMIRGTPLPSASYSKHGSSSSANRTPTITRTPATDDEDDSPLIKPNSAARSTSTNRRTPGMVSTTDVYKVHSGSAEGSFTVARSPINETPICALPKLRFDDSTTDCTIREDTVAMSTGRATRLKGILKTKESTPIAKLDDGGASGHDETIRAADSGTVPMETKPVQVDVNESPPEYVDIGGESSVDHNRPPPQIIERPRALRRLLGRRASALSTLPPAGGAGVRAGENVAPKPPPVYQTQTTNPGNSTVLQDCANIQTAHASGNSTRHDPGSVKSVSSSSSEASVATAKTPQGMSRYLKQYRRSILGSDVSLMNASVHGAQEEETFVVNRLCEAPEQRPRMLPLTQREYKKLAATAQQYLPLALLNESIDAVNAALIHANETTTRSQLIAYVKDILDSVQTNLFVTALASTGRLRRCAAQSGKDKNGALKEVPQPPASVRQPSSTTSNGADYSSDSSSTSSSSSTLSSSTNKSARRRRKHTLSTSNTSAANAAARRKVTSVSDDVKRFVTFEERPSGWKLVQANLGRIIEYGRQEGILPPLPEEGEKEHGQGLASLIQAAEETGGLQGKKHISGDKVNLPTNDISLMHEAIPFLPLPVALLCMATNICLPGTLLSGLFGLCMGQPRINVKEGRSIVAFIVNACVGVAQFMTITFFLVGWFWSIAWGGLLIIHSMQYREALRQRRKEAVATAAIEALTKDSILHRRDVKTLVKAHGKETLKKDKLPPT